MNLLKGIAFLLLRILCANTEDIVSEEKHEDTDRTNDNIQEHAKGAERRFLQDLDDRDWHVSHLKETDFEDDNDCNEETFADKAKKYRKTLKEDGALVEYVLSRPLPVNEEDLIKNKLKDKCVAANKTIKGWKSLIKEKQKNIKVREDTEEIISKEIYTATTADLKQDVKESGKVENATEKKSRRASEYQFSSSEYYEEVEEFDDDSCPDSVEVIRLEIDTLRSYDVDCEVTLEWRSLE